jgi:hypothetical protein
VAEELTLFFDRNAGKQLPSALLLLKCPFEVKYHQGEGYKPNTEDDVWLHDVGPKKWVVLSYDAKWQDESAATEAIKQHKIGCFYLPGASSIGFFRLISLARSYARMREIVAKERRPFIYKIDGRNRFKKLL